tara:strand:+ start:225333 stop:226733 length:1401 start_codon:yes stop_codon:yes gene_type:complete
MPGHKNIMFRQFFGRAPLPVAALAAVFAGFATLMIWQSPRNIVADVKPLIMDFGRSKVQSSSDRMSEPGDRSTQQAAGGANATGGVSGSTDRSLEPVRTQRSNGGLVLEWPQQKTSSHASSGAADDAKSQAKKVLAEAEEYFLAGDLRRALISARLAYSYPVKWEQGEQSPEELLTRLEALANDPTFMASARREAISRINSANTTNSGVDQNTTIGVWKPALTSSPASSPAFAPSENPSADAVTLAAQVESDTDTSQIETVSASRIEDNQPLSFPAIQPYHSEPTFASSTDDEPRRLNVDTHRQVSESSAEFAASTQVAPIQQVEPRPLIITDQRAAAPAASPLGALTFDVLATLTTIFAVLFFGALFLFLAILAVGKKLIGEKGVAFRIELVNNSPLTIQTAGAVPAAAPAQSAATNELKIDPDFEGILSLSEQRARQRESAILEQFIQNNVSLHNEIGASRAAA